SFLRTADGGRSWQPLPSDIGNDYTGMSFADADRGWLIWQTTGAYAAAPPEVAETHDGGRSWDVRVLPAPEGAPTLFEDYEYSEPYGLNVLSATALRLMVGAFGYGFPPSEFAGYLYTTEDGGATWNTYALPAGALASEYDLAFFDADYGLLLGRTMYRTADGGRTWQLIKTVAWDGDFSFADSQYGWAIARSGEATALVRTVNGGTTWSEVKPRAAP
ncbi:MAG TPA: YCF48-related protein, partial [Anaerolineales bacterium]|nr:YCF48-related protein [Anaerolineales bacterium]